MEDENNSLEQDNVDNLGSNNNSSNVSNANSSSNGATFLNAVNKVGNIASGISNLKAGNGGNSKPDNTGNVDNNSHTNETNQGNNKSSKGAAAANLAGKALDVGAKFNPALKGLKTAKDIASKAGALSNIRAKNGPQLPNNSNNGSNENTNNNEDQSGNKNSLLGGPSGDSEETSEGEGKAKGFSPLNLASTVAGGSSPINLIFGGSIKVKIYLALAGAIGSLLALLLPVLIIAAFIGSFASLFSANTIAGGDTGEMDYIAATEDEAAYQERLTRVISRYGDEGDPNRVTAAEAISAGLSIIQQNDTEFSYGDMTERRMEQIADLAIEVKKKQGDEEEFEAYSEEEAKANFVDYYRSYFSALGRPMGDEVYTRMANDTYDFISDYHELISIQENDRNLTTSSVCSSDSYWWPIGSQETTTQNGVTFASGSPETVNITAWSGSADSVHQAGAHIAIDIAASDIIGHYNVIAAKDGVVVYPTSDSQTQYPDTGGLNNNDGGQRGNYVVIEHSDGNYTYYQHLAQNSITVRAGDQVRQGQVIGKMGHSGRSTGTHLHFEVRVGANTMDARVNPLDYVDPDNPRPACAEFSLTSTSLSKQEFVAKMKAYCESSGNSNFCTNFANHAEEVYTVSVENNVNPELVVVTAGTEQGWGLCADLYNFWGIGISNGEGCYGGPILRSLADGIRAYADTLAEYQPGGNVAGMITNRYNESEAAGCDPAGHGLPGTLAGMQSIYSYIGAYRYSPGSSGLGGCHILKYIYGDDYCTTHSVCTNYSNCPESSRTTVCEQNDYTAWVLEKKVNLRKAIFGL